MGVFSIPLSTTQLSQTLLPHLTQRHLDFQTIGDVFALRGIQLRKAAGQKFREDLSKVGVDLDPGLVKSLLLVLVQVDYGLFDLALITNDRLHHVLQRRLLLLNAVNHVHDLGVDLVLHSLESLGHVAQRRFALRDVLVLEVIGSIRTPKIIFFVRNPLMFFFHVRNSLRGSILIFLKLLKLMPKLLHFETFFGDPGVLRLHRFLELPQLLVKASQFGSFIVELGLSHVMGILYSTALVCLHETSDKEKYSLYLDPSLFSLH